MRLKLRMAKKTDMKSVLHLIKELAAFENEADAVKVNEDILTKDGFGDNPQFQVFVAELENEIVGIALFYKRYSTWKGKCLHLEDLIIREKHRGEGIGKQLYHEVLKYAYLNNYKRVAWEVLNWNTSAIKFYESTGAKVFDTWRVAQMDENGIEKYVRNNDD